MNKIQRWLLDRFYIRLNKRLIKAISKSEEKGITYTTVLISERSNDKVRTLYYRLVSLWDNLGYNFSIQERHDRFGYCRMGIFICQKI